MHIQAEGHGAAPKHLTWSSRGVFLMSAVGAATGLGNLWRFPYVAGENGGGAFILVYILFVCLLGIPIMTAEMVIGRRGQGSAVQSMRNLIATERVSPGWKIIGWFSLLIPFVGLSYYSIVASWVTDYVTMAVGNRFADLNSGSSLQMFNALTGSVGRQLFFHAVFLGATVWIVSRGIHRGIEKASKIMIPSLFVILVGLVIYNGFTVGLAGSFKFLFTPDFARLSVQGVLIALGQAFFSVAIGVGVMMTYAAYIPRETSLPQSAAMIAGADTFVSLLAGLAIFPVVFHYGLNPGEGPNLLFVTLPIAFGQMPGGQIIGTLFFILVLFAALTTAIGMLEPVVAWLVEKLPGRRSVLTFGVGLAAWVVGLPSLLSFNLLKGFHPAAWLKPFASKTIFDLLDFTIANFLLPLNGLLIALFVGWALNRAAIIDELDSGGGPWFRLWRAIIRYVAPLAIAWIMLDLWF